MAKHGKKSKSNKSVIEGGVIGGDLLDVRLSNADFEVFYKKQVVVRNNAGMRLLKAELKDRGVDWDSYEALPSDHLW